MPKTMNSFAKTVIGLSVSGFLMTCTPVAYSATPSLHGVIKNDKLWSDYKAHFLKKDGRIVDNGNKNVSHSEGQGFAMLMAVAADDKQAFKRLWAFTQQKLGVRKDGLFAWRYKPGIVFAKTDKNNATDGDILIAWALLEASEAGFGSKYRKQAQRVLRGVKRLVVGDKVFARILLPAAYGFTPAHHKGRYVVNLSYWVFPAFERIHTLTGDPFWKELVVSGERVLKSASKNRAGLPADWTAIRRNSGRATTAAKFTKQFSYNAVRVPLYLAWANDVNEAGLRTFQKNWIGRRGGLQRLDVRWNVGKGSFSGPGYHAVAATVNCALQGKPFPVHLRSKIENIYYPASLHMLSIIATKQRYPKCWN